MTLSNHTRMLADALAVGFLSGVFFLLYFGLYTVAGFKVALLSALAIITVQLGMP